MRILAIGDVMGKTGRQTVATFLPRVREQFNPDLIILNGENAAGGFGLTEKIYTELTTQLGIDVITMGNHWHDKREIYDFHPKSDRLVLPGNMANISDETDGLRIIKSKSGTDVAIINLIGKAFMHGENRSFFETCDRLLDRVPSYVKVRVIDMHAEASSEKQAMAQEYAGRVSLIYGTHSHVPTADERIVAGFTGYVTDIGMTGAYDSVIGIRKDAAILRLKTGEKKHFEPAVQDPWMCFVIAEIDGSTGACKTFERHRWELNKMSDSR